MVKSLHGVVFLVAFSKEEPQHTKRQIWQHMSHRIFIIAKLFEIRESDANRVSIDFDRSMSPVTEYLYIAPYLTYSVRIDSDEDRKSMALSESLMHLDWSTDPPQQGREFHPRVVFVTHRWALIVIDNSQI